ncbi:MAG: NADH-quinone oxidoreductase subunit N [Deltaproteobacteria bacterium]|nr:NADH-quinone oxidoreductase subunit N [Deltaproteobacteria bacterium]
MAFGAVALMLIDAFQDEEGGLAMPAALVHFVAGSTALLLWKRGLPLDSGLLHGYLVIDKTSLFLDAVIGLGGGLASLLAGGYLHEHKLERGEYYPLLGFASCGAMMLVSASDTLMLFVALETMSLGVYAMTGYRRTSARALEAALKYFLLGSFAAALLLAGAALLYTVTGHTDFAGIAQALHPTGEQPPDPFLVDKARISILAMLLILAALAFKVGAVPFHMWVPDTYEGAPTSTTAYMSVVVKTAAFGVFLRLMLTVFGDAGSASSAAGWPALMAWVAVLTMTVGNLAALVQTSVKRMLAYSSIAHAGYLLVGVVLAPRGGGVGAVAVASVLFYLLAYTVSNVGAFGALMLAGRRGAEAVSFDDLAGLGKRHPWAAFALTFFLLSLTGVPPTAGFFGKFYIVRTALDSGLGLLAAIVVVNSAVSAYYYLGVIVKMFMKDPAPGATRAQPMASGTIFFTLVGAALGVLYLGLLPERVLSLALAAAERAAP